MRASRINEIRYTPAGHREQLTEVLGFDPNDTFYTRVSDAAEQEFKWPASLTSGGRDVTNVPRAPVPVKDGDIWVTPDDPLDLPFDDIVQGP